MYVFDEEFKLRADAECRGRHQIAKVYCVVCYCCTLSCAVYCRLCYIYDYYGNEQLNWPSVLRRAVLETESGPTKHSRLPSHQGATTGCAKSFCPLLSLLVSSLVDVIVALRLVSDTKRRVLRTPFCRWAKKPKFRAVESVESNIYIYMYI